MPNIHNLTVVYDSTSSSTGSIPIDLNCGTPEVNKSITSGIYDLDFTPPKKVSNLIGLNTVFLTKIEGCDGSFVLVEETVGDVSDLIISLCGVCQEINSTKPILGEDCETPVHSKDCDREALITMLQTQLDELIKIYGAVDGLELTTENIRIEAGQINLSTDEVEALLTQIKELIALKGSDCANATFTKDCDRQALLDKIGEVVTALNTNSQAEQVLLTSVKEKIEALTIVVEEFKQENNTNLLDVIAKLELQIAELILIKEKIEAGNVVLADIKIKLQTVNENLVVINDTLVEKFDIVNSKLDSVISGLTNINTTLQTEFDQTQVKLDQVITAIEFAHDTFQLENCDGTPIGVEENVIKVVQLAKQVVKVCNVTDITTPIVEAINNQTSLGKRHDVISLEASVGNVYTLASVFTTVSMFVSKGEFKIEAVNDFSSDITATGGTLSTFIELSSDGIGTETGSTDVAQSLDTRANSKDLEAVNNSYTITCIRAGVMQLELFK